ncbi:MAG TPA: AAA family ATPase, partial [Candidatus Saccharimonadales bacterium]|nr:AAA family ATPase [Candidatus Saccharimonadales bacterium]
MSHVIAILNQKGGVGKTTTALSLAAYLAKAGRSVLVVDFDPQGNATSGLGQDKQAAEVTTYDILFDSARTASALQETNLSNLYLLPSNENLAAAEIDLSGEQKREFKLRDALLGLEYDFILIDCPPALGLLTINALTAADYLLIPVQAEYYALEGLSQLLSVVQRVRGGLNPGLELLGVIITMFDGRTALAEQVHSEIKKHFSDKVFNTVIPRNVRLAEAPSYGRTILEHDKWSKGARAYKNLSK